MGLIKAAVSAVSGNLADQWLEVLEPDNMSGETLMTKGVLVNRKKGANTKGNRNIVSNGSVVHVYPNQMMLLVDGGKIIDYCAEEGYYTVNTSTTPSLFNGELKASLKGSANSQVEDAVGDAIEQIAALAQLCGHPARFERGQQQDFYCQCGTCQTTWSLKTTGERQHFSMRPKGASAILGEDGFLWAGRDWLELDLGSAP